MGVMKSSPISLKPNERVARITKEHHVRKQQGRYLAYIVEDKFNNHLILGQKLSSIVDLINEIVDDEPDKISVAGLYNKLYNPRDSGEYLRHRWRIRPYSIEQAADKFNSIRTVYSNAALAGSKECYSVCV